VKWQGSILVQAQVEEVIFIFLEYRNTVAILMMDEVKIIESSNSKSFPSHPQTEISIRTLSGPTRATPKFKYTSQKPLTGHCPALLEPLQNSNTLHRNPGSDNVWKPNIVRHPLNIVRNLNLSPTVSFLRELYKYTSASNGSKELAIAISC
jgi:hypothetical protein